MTSNEHQQMSRSWRAYAELVRVSNVPTIISNVLVGYAIGAASTDQPIDAWLLLLITPAIILFYISGMALNDVVDAAIDQRERPSRPIPSGRVSRFGAGIFAALCMAIGLAMIAPLGFAALLLAMTLVVMIVAYDMIHKNTPLAGVLMGACRGLVYLTVAACFAWPLHWHVALPLALAITAYISIVTLIARGEAGQPARMGLVRRFSIMLPLVALLPALWVVPSVWDAAIGAALLTLGWLVWTQRHVLQPTLQLKPAVLGYLAGICLLDALYLTLLDHNTLAIVALACFVVTIMGHRIISGT